MEAKGLQRLDVVNSFNRMAWFFPCWSQPYDTTRLARPSESGCYIYDSILTRLALYTIFRYQAMYSIGISPPVRRSAPEGTGGLLADVREWETDGLIRPPLLFSHHIHDFRVRRSTKWIKPARIISERGRWRARAHRTCRTGREAGSDQWGWGEGLDVM